MPPAAESFGCFRKSEWQLFVSMMHTFFFFVCATPCLFGIDYVNGIDSASTGGDAILWTLSTRIHGFSNHNYLELVGYRFIAWWKGPGGLRDTLSQHGVYQMQSSGVRTFVPSLPKRNLSDTYPEMLGDAPPARYHRLQCLSETAD